MLVQVAPELAENPATQGAISNHTPSHALVFSAPGDGLASATPATQAMMKPQITAFAMTAPLPPNPSQGETSRKEPSTRLVQSIQDSADVLEFFLMAFEFTISLHGVGARRAAREA